MTHLRIEQSQSSVENVNIDTIEKLYQFAKISNVEDQNNNFSMYLSGNISSSRAYEDSVLYLRQKFPNLIISVQDNNYYIRFADSEVERILVESSLCSDGIGFSIADATSVIQIPQNLFTNNSTIETFNELNKFGSIIIGSSAFYNCSGLKKINLSTVTQIQNDGFRECGALQQEISIPNLTSIGSRAFRYCTSIERVINLGDTITQLPDSCFEHCTSLTEINIPNSITSLGRGCFKQCTSLIEINSPNDITNIPASCFEGCTSLTYFDLSNKNSIGDSAFNTTNFIGNSVNDPVLRIPNLSVNLGQSVFKGTKITQIADLGNITSIGDINADNGGIGTFRSCTNLITATIPPTVTSIGTGVFSDCRNLTNINIVWENLTKISSAAFEDHPDWNFIINLANCTNLGFNSLGNGSSGTTFIKQLYIPKLQYGDKHSAFKNYISSKGQFKGIRTDLLYLRDIETFYPGQFANANITCLVINNTIPPEWRNFLDRQDSEVTSDEQKKDRVLSNSTITNIYVPDTAVSTYQNDINWSTVQDKIKPLSQLTKVATELDLQSGQIALIEAYM